MNTIARVHLLSAPSYITRARNKMRNIFPVVVPCFKKTCYLPKYRSQLGVITPFLTHLRDTPFHPSADTNWIPVHHVLHT